MSSLSFSILETKHVIKKSTTHVTVTLEVLINKSIKNILLFHVFENLENHSRLLGTTFQGFHSILIGYKVLRGRTWIYACYL